MSRVAFIGSFTAVALEDSRVWVEWYKSGTQLRGTIAGFKELSRVAVSTYIDVGTLALNENAERLGASSAHDVLRELRKLL